MVLILLYAWPFFELLQGYLYADESKSITNLAAISVQVGALLCVAVHGVKHRSFTPIAILSGYVIVVEVIRIIFYGHGAKEMLFDLSPLVRGLFLFFSIDIFLEKFKLESSVKKYIFYSWLMVCLLIAFSAVSGVGLKTYEKFDSGYKFYFAANNEITLVVALLAVYLIINSGILRAAFVLVVSAVTFLVIGTKGGFLYIVVGICAFYFSRAMLERNVGKTAFLFSSSAALVVLILANVDFFLQASIGFLSTYSSGASKLLEKIEYVGAYSALVGERDGLVLSALAAFWNGSITQQIFGLSFFEYAKSFYIWNEPRFAEVDGVDVLCGWGWLGFFLYVLFFLLLYKREMAAGSRKPGDTAISIDVKPAARNMALITAFLVAGNTGGHAVLFSYPMVAFALVLARNGRAV
ncbi:O-antigen ligase family protein [Solimonas variicoloris]|uniref:O-antigen ligase family protein n=1 Tax=Solimonas variicoloris TaxID=254408 RepID=UPI00146EC862